MSGSDYDALLRRRRIWGVPPDAVEQMATECERTQAELRAKMQEMEVRLAHLTAERDEAHQSVITLEARVERLEREKAEIANRPEMVREEALRFVVDAWTEAQTIREQTRQEIEAAEAAARDEVAAVRQALVEEREHHEAEMRAAREGHEREIALLRERRLKAIADLESLAENLLNQAVRVATPTPSAPAAESTTAHAVAEAVEQPAQQPDQTAPEPAASAPPHTMNGDVEDQMLAKALDDLEAILSASRKPNGTGG